MMSKFKMIRMEGQWRVMISEVHTDPVSLTTQHNVDMAMDQTMMTEILNHTSVEMGLDLGLDQDHHHPHIHIQAIPYTHHLNSSNTHQGNYLREMTPSTVLASTWAPSSSLESHP